MVGKQIVIGCYLKEPLLMIYNKDRAKYNKIATDNLRESILHDK